MFKTVAVHGNYALPKLQRLTSATPRYSGFSPGFILPLRNLNCFSHCVSDQLQITRVTQDVVRDGRLLRLLKECKSSEHPHCQKQAAKYLQQSPPPCFTQMLHSSVRANVRNMDARPFCREGGRGAFSGSPHWKLTEIFLADFALLHGRAGRGKKSAPARRTGSLPPSLKNGRRDTRRDVAHSRHQHTRALCSTHVEQSHMSASWESCAHSARSHRTCAPSLQVVVRVLPFCRGVTPDRRVVQPASPSRARPTGSVATAHLHFGRTWAVTPDRTRVAAVA